MNAQSVGCFAGLNLVCRNLHTVFLGPLVLLDVWVGYVGSYAIRQPLCCILVLGF